MKKIVALLVIAAVVAPAMAATTITGAQVGTTNSFTISYTYTAGTSFPRAFALDITVPSGKTITAMTATMSGESTTTTKGFGIFPGTIIIDSATGSIQVVGTPVAQQGDLPSGTLPGLNTTGVTVELGSLYATTAAKPVNGPAVILTGAVSALPTTVTVVANAARGGLVLEDATTATFATLNIPLAGGVCKGDVNASGKVDSLDIIALAGKLNTYGGTKTAKTIPSSNTNYSLAGDANVDGSNTSLDIIKIAGWLNTYGGTKTAKTITCPHTYN